MKTRTQKPDPRWLKKSMKSSFTLIEMLAVCAIIAILTGILYPALRTIRDGPKKAQARADIRKLELAIQSYYNEYGKWPDTSGATPAAATDADFITMLNGNRHPYTSAQAASGSYASNYNPRAIRFMEVNKKQSSSDGLFLDPWGTPYIILIDNGQNSIGYSAVYTGLSGPVGGWWQDVNGTNFVSNDGMLRNRPDTNYVLKRSIAIYSFGPNKTDDLAQGSQYDDITNWY